MLMIDAKTIPTWRRENFLDMQSGGLSAACVVCSMWDDFTASARKIMRLKSFVASNADLLYLVRAADDIINERSNRVGIVLSWVNSTGFADALPFVDLFAQLGLKIAAPAFFTATAAGSGCYESTDTGLTDFGRELVRRCNAVGIALDMAHLGEKTEADVLAASTRPPFYSQSNPHALNSHPRNKTDAQMRQLADKGGVVSVAALPHYLPSGLDSTVDDLAAAIVHVRDVAGEDAACLGSDLVCGQTERFYQYVCHDKGHGRRLIDYSTPPVLPGMSSFKHYANVVAALEKRGLTGNAVEKIMGANLLRYFGSVWAL